MWMHGPQTKPYVERKFDELLAEDVMNLKRLRELSWGGIPERYRATIWRLLLGYLPANRDRREVTLKRKRKEYADMLPRYLNIPPEDRSIQEQVRGSLRPCFPPRRHCVPPSRIQQSSLCSYGFSSHPV